MVRPRLPASTGSLTPHLAPIAHRRLDPDAASAPAPAPAPLWAAPAPAPAPAAAAATRALPLPRPARPPMPPWLDEVEWLRGTGEPHQAKWDRQASPAPCVPASRRLRSAPRPRQGGKLPPACASSAGRQREQRTPPRGGRPAGLCRRLAGTSTNGPLLSPSLPQRANREAVGQLNATRAARGGDWTLDLLLYGDSLTYALQRPPQAAWRRHFGEDGRTPHTLALGVQRW